MSVGGEDKAAKEEHVIPVKSVLFTQQTLGLVVVVHRERPRLRHCGLADHRREEVPHVRRLRVRTVRPPLGRQQEVLRGGGARQVLAIEQPTCVQI